MKLFKCCMECKPPKRHLNCHSTCEEYLKDKEVVEARNKALREYKENEYRNTRYYSVKGQR